MPRRSIAGSRPVLEPEGRVAVPRGWMWLAHSTRTSFGMCRCRTSVGPRSRPWTARLGSLTISIPGMNTPSCTTRPQNDNRMLIRRSAMPMTWKSAADFGLHLQRMPLEGAPPGCDHPLRRPDQSRDDRLMSPARLLLDHPRHCGCLTVLSARSAQLRAMDAGYDDLLGRCLLALRSDHDLASGIGVSDRPPQGRPPSGIHAAQQPDVKLGVSRTPRSRSFATNPVRTEKTREAATPSEGASQDEGQ